jgi:hypothetical protein
MMRQPMNILETVIKKFEDSMAAISFAEAGEFETASQFFKPQKNAHKRVLLGTDRMEVNPKTLHYAMRLCKYIGGTLEIFHMLSLSEECMDAEHDQKDRLVEIVQGSSGGKDIVYRLVIGEECLATEVLKYTNNRRDLLCVVFDALESGNVGCRTARETMLAKFHALHCPVVVYAEQQSMA